MENNTLISHELEQMRSQIGILKDKLEKQNIVNEQHIRNSMKSKMSSINRTIAGTIVAGAFALPYCTWFFWSQDLSKLFIVATAIMLTVCLGLTILQQVRLKNLDFSGSNLVETAEQLSKVKKHYSEWHWVALPMIIIWLGWLMYEMISKLGNEPYVIGFCCGAAVGAIIGGIIGFRINRKVIRKTGEILEQIEELQRES
ncbi:MAG: hypothetical protein J6B97_10495 [Bacteroidales bacterium]|nr:hypothetical protein [Bacteroidales bacterium]